MDLELTSAIDFCPCSLSASVSLRGTTQSDSFSSPDEFALGSANLGFLSHTQLFCIYAVGLGHFHMDDSCAFIAEIISLLEICP